MDIYRGRIALKSKRSGRWRWAFLPVQCEAIAPADQPNEHVAIRRTDGAPVGRFDAPRIGALLTDEELATLATTKHGLVS